MRIFSLALVLALAACARASDETPAGEEIACALDGAANFARVCTLERGADLLVVHRPDGGFRRFALSGGRGIEPIDGAGAAAVASLADGSAEIALDGDRYRIPGHALRP